jgi:site-specific DNA-methyltransferase (adenine-specific)
MNEIPFSHKSDEWSTPSSFFEELNAEFNFTLDPCATDENHKAELYYTKKEDGLVKSWEGHTVFCNPPYSEVKKWVKKAYEESLKPNTCVVLLVPSRTDTQWFHDYVLKYAEIRFVRGRLRFGGSKNSAPFPSLVAIFAEKHLGKE